MKALRPLITGAALTLALTVCASAGSVGNVCFTAASATVKTEIQNGGTMLFTAYDSSGKMKEAQTVELLPTALYKSVSADFTVRLTASDTVKAFLVKSDTFAPLGMSAASSPLIVGTITEHHALLVIAAENYLDAFPMSRDGLIEQLMFDGYALDEAVFAVTYADIDWTAQAERAART